jgi:RNA polymerase sigma-70 factor (ECF subfamily)
VSAIPTGIPAPTRTTGAERPAGRGGTSVDPELDRLWLRGDPSALDRAHAKYRPRLEAVAYRILRNRADAEDVVQRIFLALRRVHYQGQASLWTYLYRAAVNGAVNVLRARRRREAAEQQLALAERVAAAAPARGAESSVLEGEILAEVASALLRVKPQHRRVLVLRIVHGLSNTEIAQMESLPLATVGTWLRRGRRELQRALGPLLRELGRDGP